MNMKKIMFQFGIIKLLWLQYKAHQKEGSHILVSEPGVWSGPRTPF